MLVLEISDELWWGKLLAQTRVAAASTNLGVAWPPHQIGASQVKSGQILCPIFFQSMQYTDGGAIPDKSSPAEFPSQLLAIAIQYIEPKYGTSLFHVKSSRISGSSLSRDLWLSAFSFKMRSLRWNSFQHLISLWPAAFEVLLPTI